MNRIRFGLAAAMLATLFVLAGRYGKKLPIPADREEVVFWHFWGGPDREVVDEVVQRFNEAQQQYFVRAVAMPGNNLQAKLFLSVTGGDPPDLVNQDDPILADWAGRGVLQPFESIATHEEIGRLKQWLLPAARRMSQVDDDFFAVCNGLDIRALYFNRTALDQFGLQPPKSLADLDRICSVISPPGLDSRDWYAYLPDSRRLWAWGYVFGADFCRDGRVDLLAPDLIDALQWMAGFATRYGAGNIAAFRTGDQSLPGTMFPLLPLGDENLIGRYALVMDGQWRTRDIAAFVARRTELGLESPTFGVCPLPPPAGGRKNAGWVNGNFFVIPRGARNAGGAWEFVKFWIGFSQPGDAAKTCAAGGWIPVSQTVIEQADFQAHLDRDPLFAEFVRLAASENQFPIPKIPGASFFKRTVEQAGFRAMREPDASVEQILAAAQSLIQQHLDRQIRAGGKL